VVIFDITAAALGPHTPSVQMPCERSVKVTEPSPCVNSPRCLVNQWWSRPPSNAPVITRKWSVARRWIVRSPRKPPCGVSSGVYTLRPTGTSTLLTHIRSRNAHARGPSKSNWLNAVRSTMPTLSRICRCSALVIGLHHRASHSCSRGAHASGNFSARPALDSYHCGRSQPRASKNTAPRASSRA
jgi:hypothetical protein